VEAKGLSLRAFGVEPFGVNPQGNPQANA